MGLKLFLLAFVSVLPLGARAAGPADAVAILSKASSGTVEGLPVLRLKGKPYEIGYQHGALLRAEVRQNYQDIFKFLEKAGAVGKLDAAWAQLAPFVPLDYLEEMRGLAEGAGLELNDVHRLHAIPDIFSTECSLGAFYGPATVGGRLYALRNLDWSREFGVHRHGVVLAVSPKGKHGFASMGFAGFVGVLAGMNDAGISVGQVGSSSSEESLQGTSFVLLLRRILEEAGTASAGARIVRKAKRTVGINYMIASAVERQALALETTSKHFAQFKDDDPSEKKCPYAVPIKGAVFRSDTAFDPQVRHLQTASNGDPKLAVAPDPHGSDPYDIRYLEQAKMAKEKYGKIDLGVMFAMAKRIAPRSNILSTVFAYPDFYVSFAQGDLPAADGPFHRFNLNELLAK